MSDFLNMCGNSTKNQIVRYRLVFLFVVCFMCQLVAMLAQTTAAFTEAGDAAMLRKDYYAALHFYVEAAEAGNPGIDLYWKTAEAARESAALTMALQMYGKVVDSKQPQKYPMAEYWKAFINKSLGNYKAAKEGYELFITQKNIPEKFRLLAKNDLKACTWAIGLTSAPKDVTIEHLGKNVNSPYSEFGAVKRNDTLIFSSLRFENKADNQIPPRLITKSLEAVGQDPARPLPGFNAENLHTASLVFSAKEAKVIYCQCEYPDQTEQIRCDLYSRNRKGNGWSKPRKLPDHINLPKTSTTQPALGLDEKGNEILFFVSDRKEGKGKHDIWYSFVLANDQYSAPVNITAINTKEDEMTPFYLQKNKTLYFSSDGYQTMGGLDIFSSEKKGGVFTAPYHMGFPLNSSGNDFYFSVLADGKEGYFSSNRMGSMFLDSKNETCCYDIYNANLPPEILQPTSSKDTLSLAIAISPDKVKKNIAKKSSTAPKISNKSEPIKPIAAKTTPTSGAQPVGNQPPVVADSQEKVMPEKNGEKVSEKVHENISEKVEAKSAEPAVGKVSKGETKLISPVVADKVVVTEVDTSKIARKSRDSIVANVAKTVEERSKVHRKLALDEFLPLPLYFDNDEPDRNTTSTTTIKTYEESFNSYYSKKLEYMERSGKGMPPLQKIQTETDMMLFFEQTIKPNFEKLKEFTPALLHSLELGDKYEIIVKGYASPLAKNQYNNFLGQRRVRSLFNFWNTYENSAFEKYFKNGQLKLTLVSFGEETAAKNISDDEHNEAGSIYNIRAAKERRIEIIEVKGEEK